MFLAPSFCQTDLFGYYFTLSQIYSSTIKTNCTQKLDKDTFSALAIGKQLAKSIVSYY
jgi:hypothetical protein